MNPPGDPSHAAQAPLPRFAVELAPPDIACWLAGNTGVPGFTSASGRA